MSAVTGLVGLGGGVAGTSIAGPTAANIGNPVGAGQLNTAYNGAQGALGQQQALLTALQGQGGIQNQSNVYGQLQNIAAGQGPNPAQAMLSQATGQNIGNQAALMAGQRGAGANVGLMARQAAQQGAATQQQAVGQGATMQANQSLTALGQAGNIAGSQVSNLMGATGQNTAAQQSEQQALLNAQNAYNQQQVAMQSNINSANAGLANTQLQGQQSTMGGLMNTVGGGMNLLSPSSGGGQGLGSTLGLAAAAGARGGMVTKYDAYADGGMTPASSAGPQSTIGQLMTGRMQSVQPMAKGGMTHDYRTGGKVNAHSKKEQAVKKGNSYANDKIPAVLSAGEVVIPRSVMQGKDPVGGSAQFVQQVLAKKRMKK